MDEDRNYLKTTIFIRDGFKQSIMSEKMSEKNSKDSWKNNLDHRVMIDQKSFWIEGKYSTMSELELEVKERPRIKFAD